MSREPIEALLLRFPKVRPSLPPEIERIYVEQYRANRSGATAAASLAQRLERWLHRRVAADVERDRAARATLEIGAGNLNQLRHEPTVGPYDVVEPFAELYRDAPGRDRVRTFFADVSEVPGERVYDRITSVAAFEHICNLPEVIARCARLLADGGTLRVSIPSEGTLPWTLGWKLTTGLEFRARHGLDYGTLMRHEHVNTALEVERLLRHFFDRVRLEVFGLSRSWSLYQFLECAGPRRELAVEYLARTSSLRPVHAASG